MTFIINPTRSAATPSRYDNPFATCWTRPGAIPFQFANGDSAQRVVDRLAAQHWWGSIVGPHGSGKSTLLDTLKPMLLAAGKRPHSIALQNGQRRLPCEFLTAIRERGGDCGTIVIVDGYEQLAWFERWRLTHRCRRTNCGLLITSHKLTRITLFIRLTPDECLVQRLVGELCRKMSTRITPEDVTASHACHGSNVREILFDLYDRHEALRRHCNHQLA
jgi:hypothetical protein